MNYAVITSSLAPLYMHPDNNSERIDEVLFGMVVDILDYHEDNWCYINTAYDYKGYIEKENISIINYELMNFDNDEKLQVISSFLDVLEKPNIKSTVSKTLPRGSILIPTGKVSKDNVWKEIFLSPNAYGWIKSELAQSEKHSLCYCEDELRESIVSAALSYLGTQYRWGGKTPFGIDCSGLCSMAYMLNNIFIFRDSRIEPDFPIREINRKQLAKGDLIYFPGHIAMYLEDNRFIHASESNNIVMINSMDENSQDYYDYCKCIKYFGSYF